MESWFSLEPNARFVHAKHFATSVTKSERIANGAVVVSKDASREELRAFFVYFCLSRNKVT